VTSTMDPMNPLTVPTPAPAGIGTLIPLGHVIVKLDVSAQTTMPDTPNGYTAQMQVMADQGDLDTGALAGAQGPPGQIGFQVRENVNPFISGPQQLVPLPNTPEYIGRYYILQDRDDQGTVVAQWAYMWYGTSYRRIMMGAWGPPGPVPNITPEVELVPPYDANGNANPSFIETSGPRLDPTWLFELAVPGGPQGPVGPLYLFPDVDEVTNAPVNGDLLEFTGKYTLGGTEIWEPRGLGALLPQAWSVPESAFSSYSGVSQQAPVASFVLPQQKFPWTPVVWGHMGAGGISLSADPLMIGCEVLLGDPTNGIQISRGLGNTLGEVNIMPHYSTPNNKGRTLTPKNEWAVVPANHTNPAEGTIYVNLWNDGQLGIYNFNSQGAQLFVMVKPMGPIVLPQQASAYPTFTGEGFASARAQRVPQ
jgi:hypothetical protein